MGWELMFLIMYVGGRNLLLITNSSLGPLLFLHEYINQNNLLAPKYLSIYLDFYSYFFSF